MVQLAVLYRAMQFIENLKPIPRGSNPYVVLERMAAVPASMRAGKTVLDMPAGNGIVAAMLGWAGYEPTGADIFPEYAENAVGSLDTAEKVGTFFKEHPEYVPTELLDRLAVDGAGTGHTARFVGADMSAVLPFDDGTFDYVLSLEGIEHISGQESVIQQYRRIMKPGGTLILSTPNILCLRSRMAAAYTGSRTLRTLVDEYGTMGESVGERKYYGHAFLVNYFQLRFMLHNNGFRIRTLLKSQYSATSLLLAPLMWPLVSFYTRSAARRWTRKFPGLVESGVVPPGTEPPYAEIVRHVLSAPALFSGTLALEAEAV